VRQALEQEREAPTNIAARLGFSHDDSSDFEFFADAYGFWSVSRDVEALERLRSAEAEKNKCVDRLQRGEQTRELAGLCNAAADRIASVLGDSHVATWLARSYGAEVAISLGETGAPVDVLGEATKVVSRALGRFDPSVLVLSVKNARAIAARGNLQLARSQLEKLVEQIRVIWGSRSLHLLSALDALYRVCGALRMPERAIEVLTEAHEIANVAGGSAEMATSLERELVRLLLQVGHYSRAITLLAARNAISSSNPNVSIREKLASSLELAWALQLEGRFKDAKDLLESIVREASLHLPSTDPISLRARGNMAIVLISTGEPRLAREMLEEIVRDGKKSRSNEHPQMLEDLNRLGMAFLHLGALDEAYELLKPALETSQRSTGKTSELTMRLSNNFAMVLKAKGELKEARALLESIIETRTQTIGLTAPDTLGSRGNLAEVLILEGELTRARQLCERLYDESSEVLGREHRDTISHLGNVASIHLGQGNYSISRDLYSRVVDARKRHGGPKHPQTIEAVSQLAIVLDAQGAREESRRLFDEVSVLSRESSDDSHPLVLSALNNAALDLQATGRLAEASDLLQKVVERSTQRLGAGHQDTLARASNLADVFLAMGDRDRARTLASKTLEEAKRALGPENLVTIGIRESLASIYFRSGNPTEALRLYWSVVAERRKYQSPSHPDVIRAQTTMALLEAERGQKRKALAIARDALLNQRRWFGAEAFGAESVFDTFLAMREFRVFGPMHLVLSLELEMGKDAWSTVVASQGLAQRTYQDVRTLARLASKNPEIAKYQLQMNEAQSRPASNLAQSAIDDLATQRARLAQSSSPFAEYANRKDVSTQDVCLALGPNDVLVNYFVFTNLAHGYAQRKGELGVFVTRRQLGRDTCEGTYSPLQGQKIVEVVQEWASLRGKLPGVRSHLVSTSSKAGTRFEEFERMGQFLGRLLLPLEIRAYIDERQPLGRVWVVRDGPVSEVPLGALRVRVKAGASELVYAVEKWPFVYADSAAEIPQLMRRSVAPAETAGSLLFGDIDYSQAANEAKYEVIWPTTSAESGAVTKSHDHPAHSAGRRYRGKRSFSALRTEVPYVKRQIAEALEGPAKVFIGSDATEQSLRTHAPGSRVLHLATHATSDPECMNSSSAPTRLVNDPFDCVAIALAGANNEPKRSEGGAELPTKFANDGILTGREVIDELDLQNVELAVLAACDTGRGRAYLGSSSMSVGTAFRIAGVETAISSAWAADNDATSRLFMRMYENLGRTTNTRESWADALIRAQRGEIARYRAAGVVTSSYYWGGFVAVGR
jgi:tetratricopeptide (TPR) repeat protein/CHAT domain-containing protein